MIFIDYWLFLIFSFSASFSALMVVLLNNAIYSVLFLILTFCNVIFILLLLGADFFAFLILIIYIGAITVLFLFVVMMLNIKIKLTKNLFYYFSPLTIFITFVILYVIINISNKIDLLSDYDIQLNWISWINELNNEVNIKIIGQVLYTHYCLFFLISSLILLVSMISVIILTMNKKKVNFKKQIIEFQLLRNYKNTIKFLRIKHIKYVLFLKILLYFCNFLIIEIQLFVF